MCCGEKVEQSTTFRVRERVLDGSSLIVGDISNLLQHNVGYAEGRSLPKISFDPISPFDTILACDRQTDRHISCYVQVMHMCR